MAIEAHYGRPMDIEWGKDGLDGKLYVLQARPETVKAREKLDTLRRYRLEGALRGARDGALDRPAHRQRPGADRAKARQRWTACATATCW